MKESNLKKQYTWSDSENDELWQHDIFNSIDECIIDAKENYLIKVEDTIAIGTVKPYVVSIDAETYLENLEEDAYEECGDAAEDWIDYESSNQLSERLTECVNQWLKETGNEPSFYKIVDVKTIEVD